MMHSEQGKLSLKKNDQVQVIAGRDKGKTGRVLKVDAKNARVTVEKVNLVKRHVRPTQRQAGGIVEKELPLHYSNVLLFCPKCNRGVRHGHKMVEKAGEKVRQNKVRVCKRCHEPIDVA